MIITNGKIELLLDEKGTQWNKQPMVVSFTGQNNEIKIISFSGQNITVPLNETNVQIETLVTPSGNAMVVGDDFVFDDEGAANHLGFSITAKTLELEL